MTKDTTPDQKPVDDTDTGDLDKRLEAAIARFDRMRHVYRLHSIVKRNRA